MINRYSDLVVRYEKWFPSLYAKTVECVPCSKHRILAYLNDGTKMEYSALDNSVRDVTRAYDTTSSVYNNEEEWRKEFGYRLRTLIAEKGMSQEELSDISGISRQMLTRYVRGYSTPSGYNLARLAAILGCDMTYLTRFNYIDEE